MIVAPPAAILAEEICRILVDFSMRYGVNYRVLDVEIA